MPLLSIFCACENVAYETNTPTLPAAHCLQQGHSCSATSWTRLRCRLDLLTTSASAWSCRAAECGNNNMNY